MGQIIQILANLCEKGPNNNTSKQISLEEIEIGHNQA